jgi:hypothetical protein
VATKRTPIRRASQWKITSRAVDQFRRMVTAYDACACTDGCCLHCDLFWAAHSILHRELGLKPGHWPAFEFPYAACPYPEGSTAAVEWQLNRDRRPEAFEIYDALARAAKEEDER